jgi:FtsX-like permease family/MacB-like periplasmic core domain
MRWTFNEWGRDLRHAARSLRRSPSFTMTAVVTLALAIGATAGMFSVVDTVLLKPLPYPDAGRLVYVAASAPGTDLPDEFGVSDEFYVQYRERAHLLANVSTFNPFTATFRVGDRVERIRMSNPTYTLFATFGARPVLGRLPVAGDSRVVVLSYGLWQRWFGGDSTIIGGDYFKTMSIPVIGGHTFDRSDALSAQNHVVISRTAAALLWPNTDAVGHRLRAVGDADSTAWFTVIGVVGDVMQNTFHDQPQPLIYIPMVGPRPRSWAASSPAYVVRTSRAETIAPAVRALVHEMAPEAPMYRVYTMAGLARRSMVQLSFTMLTLGIAASLALLLGTVGLYGVLSYVVTERTREIGVRMALGATAEQVRRMVVAQGARVLAAGVLAGVVVAVAATRTLGGLLYGVKAFDLSVFIAMSVSMIVIGLLASYMPARRASSVDPMESLRGD